MEFYLKYIESLKKSAQVFDDLTFMRFFLPIIIIIGLINFLVLGLMGIIKRKTYVMIKPSDFDNLTGRIIFKVQGAEAIVWGVLYLFLFAIIALLGLPFSAVLLNLI